MNHAARTLVVASYMGEFGWELMNWQGRVRWLVERGSYCRVVICAASDRRALYSNMSNDRDVIFCPVPRPESPGAASEDRLIDEKGDPLNPAYLRHLACESARHACEQYGIDVAGAEFLTPDYCASIWSTDRAYQSFAELRRSAPITTDVLLIPRERPLAVERNHPQAWWVDLAERLRNIGLKIELYTPRLDNAIRQLSRTRLAVGASTGGLHLAGLCRCPHFVWGSGAESRWTRLGITNRQRYETLWNPFGTPCRYDECGWQPSVTHVAEQMFRALTEIGLPRGARAPAWSLKPKWRIKRSLARLLENTNGVLPWPWTIRQFIREHLV